MVTGGETDEALLRLITANVRTPDERRGDIVAQLMSLDRGERRLQDLFQLWGRAAVSRLGAALLDYSEQRMRAVIASIPDGVYAFEDYMDSDGLTNRAAAHCRRHLHRRERTPRIDFTGSSPQAAGPVNANLAVATAAVAYVFRCLIRDDVPFTAGLFRPLEIVAPARSIVNAGPPAAMAAGNVETSQRITDVLLGALVSGSTRSDSGGEFRHHEQLHVRRLGSCAGTTRSRTTKPSPAGWALRPWATA